MTKPRVETGEKPAPQTNTRPMALDLAMAEPTPAMAAYFDKCREKLGFVPNVLSAYAHDMAKLEAFAAYYNDLMLAPSGLSKLEREIERSCRFCFTNWITSLRADSGCTNSGRAS